MLILSSTTDKVQMYLASAHSTGDLRIVCSWRDVTTTAYTPGRTVEISDGTTPVDIVTTPAASTQRVIDLINIYNADSINHTVTVTFVDNATSYVLWSGTVIAGTVLTYVDGAGWSTSTGALGYPLGAGFTSFSPSDSATNYFGNRYNAPTATAGVTRVYFPRAGTVKRADFVTFAGTAGSNEAWEWFIRINNTTDYSIQSLASASATRVWTNSSLSIAVAEGDYFEIKMVNPAWATNPANVSGGGNVYVE